METSEETACSNTSRSDQNEEEEDGEEEKQEPNKDDDNENDKVKDINGGSSSNSTIEENEKKGTCIRPYVRSKTPRLRWTNDLHLRFVQAVERLGGQERATPKLVLELMGIKELSIAHVKSHLQMYRSKKIEDPNLVDHPDGSGDRNVYNLSHLPMLQAGYNQRHHLSTRYGDHSSTIVHVNEKWIHNSFMGVKFVDRSKPRFYSSIGERIFESDYRISPTNPSFNQESLWRSHEPRHDLYTSSHTMKLNHINTCEQSSSLKRAVRKTPNCNLDLNLSLGVKSRHEEEENELCLSLYSSSSKVRRLLYNNINDNYEDKRRKDGRRTSTLDLTI